MSASLQEKIAAATEPNSLEQLFYEEGFQRLIGVDEVGRGPLAGPVVAAAVHFPKPVTEYEWIDRIKDSKKLKARDLEELDELIREHATWHVTHVSNLAIDEKGITHANNEAMSTAMYQVYKKLDSAVDLIIVDGTNLPPWPGPTVFNCIVQATPKADDRSYHAGAASIIAKVSRDTVMKTAHEQWPEFEFHKNKGYGTKVHRAAIETHGPCPIHRKTFGCVRQYVKGDT